MAFPTSKLALILIGVISMAFPTLLLPQTSKFALNAIIVISLFNFVFVIIRATKREMYLNALLIKQLEATQQAERKNMNKSIAFENLRLDFRTHAYAVKGLIELSCSEEVVPHSELVTNLKLMKQCEDALLSLLDSTLEGTKSKMKTEKMEIKEEEFSLGQLIEEVVDLYCRVGMRKGVDVLFDPEDGSFFMKFSNVKGDRGKLKQVLSILLRNAVKFTSEGHVSVRAWVQSPGNGNGYGSLQSLSDLQALNAFQKNENCMEFVFEVDDTGKGIPKDKRKFVFENYVVFKQGLGIVQSLVRILGGDIEIVDKEAEENGTCFRFNVFLTICETSSFDNTKEGDEDSNSDRDPRLKFCETLCNWFC